MYLQLALNFSNMRKVFWKFRIFSTLQCDYVKSLKYKFSPARFSQNPKHKNEYPLADSHTLRSKNKRNFQLPIRTQTPFHTARITPYP